MATSENKPCSRKSSAQKEVPFRHQTNLQTIRKNYKRLQAFQMPLVPPASW
jgi:hypothetical protein